MESFGEACSPSLELTNEKRQAIYKIFLKQSEYGKIKRGSIKSVVTMFSVSNQPTGRIWRRGNLSLRDRLVADVSSKNEIMVGRKGVQIEAQSIANIPLRRQTNIRKMSFALAISKSTLHRRVEEGLVKAHSNAMRPLLSEENKKARFRFCISMLELASLQSQPTFKNMHDYVHNDEKWFFMTKESQKYYLLPKEDEPLRTCQSKRFVPKVIFLAAVARPRFDTDGNEVFSDKIGIFPFTFKEPEKQRSKNREAGTLETKALVVTKEVTKMLN